MDRRLALLLVFAVAYAGLTFAVGDDAPLTSRAEAQMSPDGVAPVSPDGDAPLDPDAAPPASPADCGPEIATSTGENWDCTFADDFEGDELDRDKWSVMRTEVTGFTHAYECYIDDRSTVGLQSGFLELTARRLEEPYSCGGYPTEYVSGMVQTSDTFSQTYGRFEARIKFPEGSGLHGAWWMWPRDMDYGTQSGEIDIVEHWGMFWPIVSPFVHIIGREGEERGKGEYCWMWDAEQSFHTYAVEWTRPGRMVFLYDGEPCMTFEKWDPGGDLTYPQPFDKPFFLILTLALQYGAVNEVTPFPSTMLVDYVRAWE